MTYEPAGVTRADWWLSEAGAERVLKEQRAIEEQLRAGEIAAIQSEGDGYV